MARSLTALGVVSKIRNVFFSFLQYKIRFNHALAESRWKLEKNDSKTPPHITEQELVVLQYEVSGFPTALASEQTFSQRRDQPLKRWRFFDGSFPPLWPPALRFGLLRGVHSRVHSSCTQEEVKGGEVKGGEVKGGEVCPLPFHPAWCGCTAPAAHLPLRPQTWVWMLVFVGDHPVAWVTGRGCLGKGIICKKCLIH